MRGEEQAAMVGLQVIPERELCLYLEALGCATVWRMPSVPEAGKKRKKENKLGVLDCRAPGGKRSNCLTFNTALKSLVIKAAFLK